MQTRDKNRLSNYASGEWMQIHQIALQLVEIELAYAKDIHSRMDSNLFQINGPPPRARTHNRVEYFSMLFWKYF
jgi:hypothetical protein